MASAATPSGSTYEPLASAVGVDAGGLLPAVSELASVIRAMPVPGTAAGGWRWAVRQRMTAVRGALLREASLADDAWLAARNNTALRERNALLARLSALVPHVLQGPDVGRVRDDLERLVADVEHHVQRLHDLVYDEVELELGGSE